MSKGPKYQFTVQLTVRHQFDTQVMARDEDEAIALATEEFFGQLDPEFDLDVDGYAEVEDEDEVIDEEEETEEDEGNEDGLNEVDPEAEAAE